MPCPHLPVWRVQDDTGFLLQPLLQSSDLQAKRHCFDFHSGFERGKEAGQHKGTAQSSQAALFLQEGFIGQMSLIYLCHPGTPCWPIPPPLSCQLPYSDIEPRVGSGNRSRVKKKDYGKQTRSCLGFSDSVGFPVPGQGQPITAGSRSGTGGQPGC